jgi:hypothetical protein
MENPHEAEQAVLLGRIINNVVSMTRHIRIWANWQEKCNEAVKAMNHYIQVRA